MDRGAWWATVHGVARSRHDLATEHALSSRKLSVITMLSSLFYSVHSFIHSFIFLFSQQMYSEHFEMCVYFSLPWTLPTGGGKSQMPITTQTHITQSYEKSFEEELPSLKAGYNP